MKIILLYVVGILFFFSAFSGGSIGMKKVNLFIAITLFVWSYIEMEMITVRNHAELKRKMAEQLKKIPHTVSFIAPDYLSALLLDNKTETFYMIHKNKKETKLEIKAVPFLQIYEVAIEEDKKIVSFI